MVEDRWRNMTAGRVPSVLELFPVFYETLPEDPAILDLGCARGRLIFNLRKQGHCKVFGLDLNGGVVKIAGQRATDRYRPGQRPGFVVGDAPETPFKAGEFDRVIIQAMLTTVPEQDQRKSILIEASRILNENGTLYLAEFGQSWHLDLYKARYEEGMAKGYEKGTFEAKNSRTGELEFLARHFTGVELRDLVISSGLSIVHQAIETFTTRTGNRIYGHVIIAGHGAEKDE